MPRARFALLVCLVVAAPALSGCASVPKEAVALSVAVGNDIRELHRGYRETIKVSFEQMRQRGLAVIEDTWTPVMLQSAITRGNLVDSARAGRTEYVERWARAAVRAIDEKRSEFLSDLNAREAALIAKVDESFERTISANAAVTAHLNSVLKVQSTQEQLLDAAGLADLRREISDGIAQASDFAARATNELRSGSGALPGGVEPGGSSRR